MKNLLTLLLLFYISLSSFSQSCNCEKDFEFVASKIENEHPGFKLNVTKDNRKDYDDWKAKIRTKIIEDETGCIKFLNEYLSFIKDKHLRVYSPKAVDEVAYEKRLFTEKLPTLKVIEEEINYIRIPSFNSRLWKHLDQFYDSITPIVRAGKYLVVDIRNNGGGGERMYNQLLKIIRKEAPGKVAVLFNKNCASACEEVALKVSSIKNVITFGENTNGQFAYGFVKGLKTPNCGLVFVITTKKYPKRLKYEYIGVAPEIKLTKDVEWIKSAISQLKLGKAH